MESALVENGSTAVSVHEPRSALTTPRTAPVSIMDLFDIAIRERLPAAELEKLVELHERIADRDAAREFNIALAKFQQECPPLHRTKDADFATKKGGRMSYSYAPLEEVAKTIAPVLVMHGLSYTWDSTATGGMLTVICTVIHEAGHSRASSFTLPTTTNAAMSDQQKYGAAMTFAQRRTLMAALGLTPEGDTDGEVVDPTPITEDQLTCLEDLIGDTKVDRVKFLAWLGVEVLDKLPAAEYDKAVQTLKRKQEKAK